MSEFEDKLGAILNNQEAMGQIMALAQSLSGERQAPDAQTADRPKDSMTEDRFEAQGDAQEPMALLGGIDPGLMQTGLHLLQEYNRADDRNAALLEALRPFLKESRYAKLDRAVQIARLSRVIRVIFDTMKENGGLFHV